MALGQFFLGTPMRAEQIQRFTPQQQTTLNQLLSGGMTGLQQTPFSFAPIAQQARSQFAQQTVPGLAERFTSLGGGRGGSGTLSSPAFASQLGQAGAGLEESLAALQSQYNLAQQDQLLRMLQLGLTPQYETALFGAQPGALQSLLGAGQQQGGSGLLGSLLGLIPGVSQLRSLFGGSR